MQVDVENIFNSVSQTVIFRELCDAKESWQTLSFLPSCFMMHILFFTTNIEIFHDCILVSNSLHILGVQVGF
jgi:hypothetical protein